MNASHNHLKGKVLMKLVTDTPAPIDGEVVPRMAGAVTACSPQLLCKSINEHFAKLNIKISPYTLEDVSRTIEGTSALNQHSILYVEDSTTMHALYLGELMIATNNNAQGILYSEKPKGTDPLKSVDLRITELVDQIVSNNPTLVLLDYHLSTDVKGAAVAERLLAIRPGLLIIGFSSEQESSGLFNEVGVSEFVLKNKPAEMVLPQISAIAGRLQLSRLAA